jgi:hypothetical protein
MSRATSLLSSVFVVAVGLSAVACNRVRVEPVRGPDGSNEWQSISCTHMDKKCFRTAAALCPNGYYFARSAGPLPGYAAGDDDEHVVASSSGGGTRAAAPTPQAGVNARTLPPQERWGSSMYTRKSGTILVQCADARATASR